MRFAGVNSGLLLLCLLLILPVSLSTQSSLHSERLTKWANTSLHDTLRLQVADQLIRKSYWSSQPDSARLFITKQQQLATKLAHPYWVARSLHNLGSLQLRQAEYSEAALNLRQAEGLYDQQRNWYRAGQTAQLLGNTLRKQGMVPEALTALFTSLKYHELAGDRGRSGRAGCLNSLGNLYLNQKDYERASEYYEASLVLHNLIGKKNGVAANLNNLSKVYTEWGKYKTARNYLDQSLVIKRQRNDLEGIANTYKNYGDIFMQWQQLDSATHYYSSALFLQDSLGLRGDEASSLADLGVVALAREDWEAAAAYCVRGWEQAEQLGDLKVQVKNGDCLTQAYRELDQPQKALVVLSETYALRDSFLSAGNTRAMEDVRRKYQEDLTELKAFSVTPFSYWWYVGVGIVVLAGVLFWGLKWRRIQGAPATEREMKTPATTEESDVDDEENSTTPSWAEKVKAVILDELKQQREITTSSLAQQLTTSERQLLRNCREATGKTTKQFLQEVRLSYAKELIESKRVGTVAELAKAVGFKSPNYFSQRFMAQFGVRPSELLD
jgi:AraC-like DNA-binding protein/tetratricopeptide (TPR) repeat protein